VDRQIPGRWRMGYGPERSGDGQQQVLYSDALDAKGCHCCSCLMFIPLAPGDGRTEKRISAHHHSDYSGNTKQIPLYIALFMLRHVFRDLSVCVLTVILVSALSM
jgi:hypothetical protein